MVIDPSASLLAAIRACTLCAPSLADGPRPIIQLSPTASIVIIGQAPGARVHQSGVPWDDASGERLREWTGLRPELFYNPARVALVPMGFCYPGTGPSGDLPPRPECAPTWHDQVMVQLPARRLTLLVGGYAQLRYLPHTRRHSLTARVAAFRDHLPHTWPLPHPSWRSTGWMQRNPWFETDLLPPLRAAIRQQMEQH